MFNLPSVTQRILEIKQPYGGYLPIKSFLKEKFDDGITLNENENIVASLVGIAVDYLTRYIMGDSVENAFHISYLGAKNLGLERDAIILMSQINGLDDNSIIAACKLAGFDVGFRASLSAYKPIKDINPDNATIENIRIMVNRSKLFWEKYGPIICSEPTFEGGYSYIVDSGDGDYVSKDTLWDFKVSKSAPSTKHSLQLLMYYVMGLHSIHNCYNELLNLGIFNPRLNIAYICPISSIPKEVISDVENNVICYDVYQTSQKQQPISVNHKTTVFTVSDICNMTGIKKSVLYNEIKRNRLKAYKVGNSYCVTNENLQKYLKHKKIENTLAGVLLLLIILLGALPFLVQFLDL